MGIIVLRQEAKRQGKQAAHSFVEYDRNMCYNKRPTGDQQPALRKKVEQKTNKPRKQ